MPSSRQRVVVEPSNDPPARWEARVLAVMRRLTPQVQRLLVRDVERLARLYRLQLIDEAGPVRGRDSNPAAN